MASVIFIACLYYLLFALFCSVAVAHKNGADVSACTDMRPMHSGNPQPQTTQAPFTLTLSKTDLKANEKLKITLEAQPGGSAFKGFLIQVRNVGGGVPAMGSFDLNSGGVSKLLDCTFGSSLVTKSAITHNINKPKTTVTVTWNPPLKHSAVEYQVHYTVVEKADTFWVNIVHPQTITVAASSGGDNGGSVSPEVLRKLRMTYERCHTKKYGCFGVPKTCISRFDPNSGSPQLCDIMVTWSKEDRAQNDFSIVSKLIGNEVGGYVALGLSEDDKMGHDSVAGCTFPTDGKKAEVKRYYNRRDKQNELYRNGKYGVHAYEIVILDGHIFCGFTQSDHTINDEVIDFNRKYFLLLARGPKFTAKGLGVHPRVSDRAVSETAIRVTDYFIATSKPETKKLVFLHGSVMLFTWLVVAPTGALTARYYKLTKVDRLVCKKPFWFVSHVTCMATTATLTFSGAIIIFSRKDWIFESMYYHNVLGVVLNVTLVIQVVIALLRPSAEGKSMKLFRWIHFTLSIFLNCTAISCIFLARDIRLADIQTKNRAHGHIWITFCIIIVVFQLSMHLILTYHTYWADGEMKVHENYQFRAFSCGPLGPNGLLKEQPGRRFRFLMMLSYIIFSVLIAIVLICLLYI